MTEPDPLLHRGPGRPRKELPDAADEISAGRAAAGQAKGVALTETTEFIEAVAKVKAEFHAEIAPLIEALKQSRGEGVVENDLQSTFRQMAMAIAEISDQDQNRKRVPPEELAKRARARAQMFEAIARARRKTDDYKAATGENSNPGPNAPLYLMTGKAYLDEVLIEPFEVDVATKKPYPVTVNWLGVPNEVMKPINEAAKEIFGFFAESIGGSTELVSPQAQAWLGSGGLVVAGMHGVPVTMQKHRAPPNPEELAAELFQRGPGQFDPRRDRINILGTLAEPAKHVAMGGPEPRKGV